MKNWLLVFLFMLFSYPAIAANPSGCGMFDVGCVASQFGVTNYGVWAPSKGRILYFGDQKRFQIDLYFDQNAVSFYQANHWAGFEIDITPRTGNLSMIQAGSVCSDNVNSKPMRDTIIGDQFSGTRGITVANPLAISEGWISFSFNLKQNPSSNTTIRANIQLVANAFDLSFISTIRNNNSSWWMIKNYLSKWLPVALDGNVFAYAMPGGGEKVFSFFAMANAEQAVEIDVDNNKLPFKINGDIDGEGMYWTERGDINTLATKCNLYDSHVVLNMPTLLPAVYAVYTTFLNASMQDALDQLVNGGASLEYTVNNANIFIEGNHTHIIHPDYRCSKELPNGKILCWENGGDTNCWDAYKWYEFNGNIDEVSNHHNDSNWTTTRERSMCSEVYNSGDGNSSGGNSGGNSGPGYGDDSGIPNPWAGYDHDVGLKYVKIGKKSSGHWHGNVVWTENEIPNHRDFRIKVKRKGGQWKDTCAELWFSHNKYFTDDDLYLATKCKDLSDSEYDNKDEKSIYIKNVSLPAMEVGKNYYFFTVLKYDGGQNPSTRTDHDEYVKVEIISEPSGSGKSNNGSGDARWNSLPEATKAAIMSIIFD